MLFQWRMYSKRGLIQWGGSPGRWTVGMPYGPTRTHRVQDAYRKVTCKLRMKAFLESWRGREENETGKLQFCILLTELRLGQTDRQTQQAAGPHQLALKANGICGIERNTRPPYVHKPGTEEQTDTHVVECSCANLETHLLLQVSWRAGRHVL